MMEVKVKCRVGSVAVEVLFESYDPEEIFSSEVYSAIVQKNAKIRDVKREIESFLAYLPADQRIFDDEDKELFDNDPVPSSRVVFLTHCPVYPQIPQNNNNNNNIYNENEIDIEMDYYGDKLKLKTNKELTISSVKDKLKEKYSFLSKHPNNVLIFYCDEELENDIKLKEYIKEIETDGIRIVIKDPNELKAGGNSKKEIISFIQSAENSKEKEYLLNQIKDLNDDDQIDVTLVNDIPYHYYKLLNLKDYSQAGTRNSDGLTDDQIEKIKIYTVESEEKYYRKINFLLNRLLSLNSNDERFVQTLILACCDSFQKNLPNLVYRWLKTTDSEFKQFKDNVGRIVCFPAFTSTSYKEGGLGQAFGNTLMTISLIQGKRRGAMDISAYSSVGPDEKEILLSAFSFYEIESVTEVAGKREIKLVYHDAIHHRNINNFVKK